MLKVQGEVEASERSGERQPAAGQFSEPPIDFPAVETGCPRCGVDLDEGRVEEFSITDLPEIDGPRLRLFRVGVRRCELCGTTARGRHPELAADQRGATAHRLGLRLLAAARLLHYGLGAGPQAPGRLRGARRLPAHAEGPRARRDGKGRRRGRGGRPRPE